MKDKLIYVLYSITLMCGWSLLFMSNETIPRPWGVLLGLVYTFYSSYEIRKLVEEETPLMCWLKMIGPLFILGTWVVLHGVSWFSFLNPIFVGCCLLVGVTWLDKKPFPTSTLQFFVIAFIVVYSLKLTPEWDRLLKIRTKNENPNFQLNELVTNTNPEPIANLNTYYFLNKGLDTINLAASGKYTLVETWNERCPPCVKAMKELKPFYESLGNQLQQRYVYVPARKGYKLDYPKIFSYKHIGHHDRILVDVNLQEVAKLEGYPNFLIFDPNGKLVLKQHGYSSAQRIAFEAKIKEVIGL